MKDLENVYGRLLTQGQLSPFQKQQANHFPSMSLKNGRYYCQRCSHEIKGEWRLPDGSYYCRACILLGRVRSSEELYYLPAQAFPIRKVSVLTWQGQLTPLQQEVSTGLRTAVIDKKQILVKAVTGAGKTEMIYEVIADVINQGGQVCLASPRVDVCIELYHRLKRDFNCPIVLLHGDSVPYQRSPLVIATTHQLLKFYQAFDLLIVDEVDAFPYVDNSMLYHAVEQSVKPGASRIFMTATSTQLLEKKVRNGELEALHLARRFHANPLVVPRMISHLGFEKSFKKERLDKKFKIIFQKQRQTNYPLLIFFPNIDRGKRFQKLLSKYFPKERIGFVSSLSNDRSVIVEQFRQGELSVLISTTILERGVTFPCVDVFVMEAQHRLYTSSSLIQIAGRVGRSNQRPDGLVYFFHQGISKAMKRSIKEIKQMNTKGGF
ncbi:DEAD/DEAH box helicase [Streptococcus saliviloxodontae]|uniref:Competence protein ComFA n=1 Tax=Streptococcus saliviloxodontae TaxID=1349416 RepID=A0ABS2PNT7_9STRE|nr:DEAD/DEAH box helicase [Streptococcus saliviloxodontae]MBM7637085.1 competence protein ComFA [Streptococcus saliviloxodontae]